MKAYKKPEVYFEHFELSEHIAACDIKLEAGDPNACRGTIADEWGGGQVFAQALTCGSPFDDYCYQNGGENKLSTFMS